MKKFLIIPVILSFFVLSGCLGGSSSSTSANISGMQSPEYIK